MNEDRNIDRNVNFNLDISYQEYIENYYLYNITYRESIYDLYNILLENILYSEMDNGNKKYKKVATQKEINNIEKIKFNKKDAKEYNIPFECPIYYYEFQEDEIICKLKCGHYFSDKAIMKWLTYESNCCPICRYEYDYKKIDIDIDIDIDIETNVRETNVRETNVRETNLSNFFIENLQNNLFNENIINENRYLFNDFGNIIEIDNILYEVETIYRNRLIDNSNTRIDN